MEMIIYIITTTKDKHHLHKTGENIMTPEQVKAKFRAQGKTLTDWAKENGYSRNAVYRVLNGFDRGHYGKAHDIAVKLGLKKQAA